MVAAQPENANAISEAEYLAFADAQTEKYEYRDGYVYAMSGGSVRHGTITVNLSTQLNLQLANRDCTVTSPDIRVHIASKHAYRYPDVTVFCGEPIYVQGRTDTISNPAVLVEVLSPSTALIDRNEKLTEYMQIASLGAYLLAWQNEPKIGRYQRHESGEWLYREVSGLEAKIEVPSVGCTLSLSDVYRKVRWDTRS